MAKATFERTKPHVNSNIYFIFFKTGSYLMPKPACF